MAYISITNQFVASSVANANQVNQNYSDIVNGLKDGTKDIQVASGIFNTKLTSKGDVVLGTDGTNTVAFNARVGSDILPASSSTYSLGSATYKFKTLYADELQADKLVSSYASPWSGSYELSTFTLSGATNFIGGAINNTFAVNSTNSSVVSFTSVSASVKQMDILKAGKYKLSAQFTFDPVSHVTSNRNCYIDLTSSTVNFLTKIPNSKQIRMFYSPQDYPYGTLITRDFYFECTSANQLIKIENTLSDVGGSIGQWEESLGYTITPIAFT